MPTILQVLPSLVTGGVERGTVEITQSIAKAGWRAVVVSAGGRLAEAVEEAGGRHVMMPLDRKDPVSMWRNAGRLAELVRAAGVDIVHARSRAPGWSAWMAGRRTGVPFVTTYHGVYGEDLPFKRRYNSVMARGERVIVASRFVADLVAERHGVDQSRIRLIPRGIDPDVFDPNRIGLERVSRLRDAWRLPAGADVILLPGRITGWKGQSVLVSALERLARKDVVAVLAGSDQGRARVTAQLWREAQRLGVAERVRLPGDCDDMPAAMAAAHVVIHASTEPEAFGRVVIEAQAMARPVIASDRGGPAEIVQHGATGWLVPPGDPEALAKVLSEVLELSAEARLQVGRRAREVVLASFTTARMQEATLEVYRELLCERGLFGKGVDRPGRRE